MTNAADDTTPTVPAESISPPQQPPPHLSSETAAVASGDKRKRDDGEGETNKSSVLHPLYKTSLCSFYRSQRLGVCSHGDSCRFAHNEGELRPKPDGSWDPTSERAKKMMKTESAEEEDGEGGEEEGGSVDTSMMTEVLGESDPKLSKCIVHVPQSWTSEQFRNFLTEKNVVYKSAKKKKGMTIGFVSFETAEQVQTATEVLHGQSACNNSGYVLKVVDVLPRSCNKVGTKAKSARDAVTPLAHMPYQDQLEHKKKALIQTLKKLALFPGRLQCPGCLVPSEIWCGPGHFHQRNPRLFNQQCSFSLQTRSARKACPDGVPRPEWIVESRQIGGAPCKLEGIIESPIIFGYRNKCEFSVGNSVEGKPTVGFMLGNFREGVTAVEEPIDCPNVSKIASEYASIFQGFLQNSTLPIWNRFNNSGFWRQLTVREGRNPEKATILDGEGNIAEVMLMVQVCSTGVDAAVQDNEFKKMSEAFAAGSASRSPPLPLTVLVVQDHKGISNVAPADAPLRVLPLATGRIVSDVEIANTDAVNEGRIHDYVSSLKFSISPTAFFQVNTLAAEKLYSLAGDWADLGPDTLLFDVCCGTGTIGLTLAHRVGMVVGIEMNASAVSDAERNAKLNGITNCKFVCSKAEDVMGNLLRTYLDEPQKQDEATNSSGDSDKQNTKANGDNTSVDENKDNGETKSSSVEQKHGIEQFKNVVAIVDPPRMGLHPVVTKALRTHPRLRRLVYISCNPDTLVANAIELCTPSSSNVEKGNRGGWSWKNTGSAGLARHRAKNMPMSEAFKPVKAMAVDLFPHTPHCELVMLLER